MTAVTVFLRAKMIYYHRKVLQGIEKEKNMKSGLSASKFIKNNKKTCGVLLVALSLTFMAMYIVNYLLMTTIESFTPLMLEMPKKISYASLTDETLGVLRSDYEDQKAYNDALTKRREELCEKLKKIDGIEDVKYIQIINQIYSGIIGQVGTECPLLSADEIQAFLNHFDAKLTSGRMPENPGEMLCDSIILKNNNYKIGDYFNSGAYGETFKIVGVIKNPYMTSVGIPNGYTNSGWYFTFYNDEKHTDLKKLLEDNGLKIRDSDELIDSLQYRGFYDNEMTEVIKSSINMIVLVVMIFLGVSVIVAYVSFMRNRVNEYCLYASIGYSRRNIYGMIMREIIIIFAIGIVIGAVFSIGLMALFDQGAIEPKGLVSKWFYPGHILKICAALTCIVGMLQIPILITIRNIKTIDLLED